MSYAIFRNIVFALVAHAHTWPRDISLLTAPYARGLLSMKRKGTILTQNMPSNQQPFSESKDIQVKWDFEMAAQPDDSSPRYVKKRKCQFWCDATVHNLLDDKSIILRYTPSTNIGEALLKCFVHDSRLEHTAEIKSFLFHGTFDSFSLPWRMKTTHSVDAESDTSLLGKHVGSHKRRTFLGHDARFSSADCSGRLDEALERIYNAEKLIIAQHSFFSRQTDHISGDQI